MMILSSPILSQHFFPTYKELKEFRGEHPHTHIYHLDSVLRYHRALFASSHIHPPVRQPVPLSSSPVFLDAFQSKLPTQDD